MLTLFNGICEWKILFLKISFAAVMLDKLTFYICMYVYAQSETQSQEVSVTETDIVLH